MKIVTHPVAPEEVMAWLDGELSSVESIAISEHLEECAECAAIADQFRSTARFLSQWSVSTAPASLDASVAEAAGKPSAARPSANPSLVVHTGSSNRKRWAIGGAASVAAAMLLVVVLVDRMPRRRSHMMAFLNPDADQSAIRSRGEFVASPHANSTDVPTDGYAAPRADNQPDGLAASDKKQTAFDRLELAAKLFAPPPVSFSRQPQPGGGGGGAPSGIRPAAPAAQSPMIARTVSLSIQVRDFAASRVALDSILAQRHGYSAQLTVNTPENGPRSFQASLRIPSQELAAALAGIKTLGQLENETQAGEEVTQQHVDLIARLKNSREEEDRLRAIVQQRTGKIEDVLAVEEEIANVRGQIETMEAEQVALEHRVDFASVDLQLSEEYKANLNSPADSTSTRIHNAFVAGLRNAAGAVLGLLLFFEEYAPVILIWLFILGVPAYLAWRRYRKVQSRM